jgi:hypothetical protein
LLAPESLVDLPALELGALEMSIKTQNGEFLENGFNNFD